MGGAAVQRNSQASPVASFPLLGKTEALEITIGNAASISTWVERVEIRRMLFHQHPPRIVLCSCFATGDYVNSLGVD